MTTDSFEYCPSVLGSPMLPETASLLRGLVTAGAVPFASYALRPKPLRPTRNGGPGFHLASLFASRGHTCSEEVCSPGSVPLDWRDLARDHPSNNRMFLVPSTTERVAAVRAGFATARTVEEYLLHHPFVYAYQAAGSLVRSVLDANRPSLIVEGRTDKALFERAAEVLGLALPFQIAFTSGAGAMRHVLREILHHHDLLALRHPIVFLLDNDCTGQRVAKSLKRLSRGRAPGLIGVQRLNPVWADMPSTDWMVLEDLVCNELLAKHAGPAENGDGRFPHDSSRTIDRSDCDFCKEREPPTYFWNDHHDTKMAVLGAQMASEAPHHFTKLKNVITALKKRFEDLRREANRQEHLLALDNGRAMVPSNQ